MSGHVRVYELSGENRTQIGGDVDGEATHYNTGYSVAMSSDGSRIDVKRALILTGTDEEDLDRFACTI